MAWLDLKARYEKGEAVDTKNVRKHANDVLRLAQLLAPDTRIAVAEKIAKDLARSLEGIAADATVSPESLGLPGTQAEISGRIKLAYEARG